jgi:hypothetical protein
MGVPPDGWEVIAVKALPMVAWNEYTSTSLVPLLPSPMGALML